MNGHRWYVPDLAAIPPEHHQIAVGMAVELAYDRGAQDRARSDDWHREVSLITLEAWKLAQLERAERHLDRTRKQTP